MTKITMNQYEQIMSNAADKMAEYQDTITAQAETIRKLTEALENFLNVMDNITTNDFLAGFDGPVREATRALLAELEQK